MKTPNFFIVGAPKCGTTSIAAWLGDHPQVFVSDPKEPLFFNTDMRLRGTKHIETYKRIFMNATDQHLAVGEASSHYLFSTVAIREILKFNPVARFIVMLRNPVDLAVSLHAELLWQGCERYPNFEHAWNVSEVAHAFRKPTACFTPEFLRYRDACMLGRQTRHLIETAGNSPILFITLDELAQRPAVAYARTLEFLGVQHDGRTEFPVHNSSKQLRSRGFGRILSLVKRAKSASGIPPLNTRFLERLTYLNTRSNYKQPLRPDFREHLTSIFEEDISELAAITGIELGHWTSRS